MGYIINYNGFTLQDSDNSVINFLDGISRVETRVSSDYITGQHGGIIWERKMGMRTVIIRGSLFYADLTSYYAARTTFFDAFFTLDTEFDLSITRSDGVTKIIPAKVTDLPQFTESEGETMECSFEVILKCENPFFTDSNLNTGTISPGLIGGTPVPTPVPMPVGGVGESLTVFNLGDTDIYPLFTILGNITNPTVTNQTTGESFIINTNIPAGTILQAYYNNTGLYVNVGNANYLQYLSGSLLFKLQRGANVIVFNGSSFDSNASLTVSFTNEYISI